MNWFKHMTKMRNSDGVRALRNEFGHHRGYACYCMLIEVLTDNWDGKSEPIFRVDEKVLRQELGLSAAVMRRFLHGCATNVGLTQRIDESKYGNFYEIKWPNLSKIRDEYARKSGQTPDKYPDSVAPEKEEEKEKEKEEEREKKRAKNNFELIPEFENFARDEIIRTVIKQISPEAQRQILVRYKNPGWILENIQDCVSYFTAQGENMNGQWGGKIVGWLKREKRSENSRAPRPEAQDDKPLSEVLNKKRAEIEALRALQVVK